MDSLITAAARALSSGDPFGALNRVALRDDPPALALRGIAMAQLGDLDRAKTLLRRAARAFGPKEALARARCVVAEAEVALVSRDLTWPIKALDAARAILDHGGDAVNTAHARHVAARRYLLLGRLSEAQKILAAIDAAFLPPALQAAHDLVAAGIAMRHLQAGFARSALARARQAAAQAHIAALSAEIERAEAILDIPAARQIARGQERLLLLDEVEALHRSPALIVDACRYRVSSAGEIVPLTRRPILFAILRMLAEAWPDDVTRDALVARAFRAKHADESHRARLRVEIGRLRALLKPLAEVSATERGFILAAGPGQEVLVLAHPLEERHAAVYALLADGEAWSSSALALALDTSQRSVQRALDVLAAGGKVESIGHGRARRWMMPPLPGFATTLLLPAPLPIDY